MTQNRLAIQVIVALQITNPALGVLTHAASQRNLFSNGMPAVLVVGFLMICVLLPFLAGPISAPLQSGLTFATDF